MLGKKFRFKLTEAYRTVRAVNRVQQINIPPDI